MKTPKRQPRTLLWTQEWLAAFPADRGIWYESADELREAKARSARREILLRWVRMHMEDSLAPRERQCLHLHYFEAMSLREIAAHIGVHPTSVQRAIARALTKLRRLAADDPIRHLASKI